MGEWDTEVGQSINGSTIMCAKQNVKIKYCNGNRDEECCVRSGYYKRIIYIFCDITS